MADIKQRELESDWDSVKDKTFSMSDISHFSTKHAIRKKTLSRLVGTTGYVIRAKFVTSLSRHLLTFLTTSFKQQKMVFKKCLPAQIFYLRVL